MDDPPNHSVLITAENAALADLDLSWSTAEFSAEDGIGPMDSLHQAGDALVAVAEFGDQGVVLQGSGVMVAPGILLTATHVLDELGSMGPLFTTFLPGSMRAWLPIDAVTISGTSGFHVSRRIASDLSLVSCTLNSEAHSDRPLMLAPMQIALPLIGERVWAMGFRHQHIGHGGTFVTPLITSGLVTAAYPNGRGELMPSPCFEVAMQTFGGMSGGAVVNSDGYLIGIVSSSFDEGPSYVTLIWEALRLSVKGPIPKLARQERVSLLGAKALGLAKIKGDVRRDPFGDVTFRMSVTEAELLTASVPVEMIGQGPRQAFNRDQLDNFVEEFGDDLEDVAARAAIETLGGWPIAKVRAFLALSGVPGRCLDVLTKFTVEDFDGVEELEITSTERCEDSRLGISFYFELRLFVWSIEVPTDQYLADTEVFSRHFHNIATDGGRTMMDVVQRCFFKAHAMFDPNGDAFSDVSILTSAVRLPRSKQR